MRFTKCDGCGGVAPERDGTMYVVRVGQGPHEEYADVCGAACVPAAVGAVMERLSRWA